ncbi:MAG: hypothetical protein QXL25_02780 [Candidatus Bathyarchaeia archaeon]|nr:hypothetical protein [Candidatus Bathyarchaeota archaeon]
MPTRRVKIEFFDKEGIKHTMTIEGHVTREKVGKVLDYIELMGGVERALPSGGTLTNSFGNRFERIRSLILSHLSDRTFLSKDVQQLYKALYGEDVPLSTISTYLSRLVDRGLLSRSGSSFEWRYSVGSVNSLANP